MKKSDFYYDLPKELIAQTAATPRDSSRMLVYNRADKSIEHKKFSDILEYLVKGDVLVINNTRVIKARLLGNILDRATKVEIFLLKRIDLVTWECLTRPARKLKQGIKVTITEELSAEIIGFSENGVRIVRFDYDGVFEDILSRAGNMPLPPYITTKLEDESRYQTIYSMYEGSSAAPTAGLHFTKEIMQRAKDKGVIIVEVMLHIGLGTFRPLKCDNILDHNMHSEYYEITQETANIINKAKSEKRRVICVGTTSVRTIESATDDGIVRAKSENTNIFIYPSYKFKTVDALITNFHLPESTLIMLVSAMIGIEETLAMYKKAVEEKYRFFSFGDATLIL